MRKIAVIMFILSFLLSCTTVRKLRIIKYFPEVLTEDQVDNDYNNGLNFLKLGQPDKALESFRRSATSTESLFVAYGFSYLQKKSYNLSKRNFKRAIEINPDNTYPHIAQMLIIEELEDREEIFNRYSEMNEKFPENTWITKRRQEIKEENLEFYLKLADKSINKGKKYLLYLKKAELFSNDPDKINLKIGRYYFDLEDYLNAEKHYLKTDLTAADGKGAMLEIADELKAREKYDEALMVYQKLQKADPDDFKLNEKVNEIKDLMYESNLPQKFKDIFFKEDLTREDLAALIGYYFDKYLEIPGLPAIISDISDSFAQEYIIKICSNKIMCLNPDHSFILFKKVTRGEFSKIIKSLLDYLERSGSTLSLFSNRRLEKPVDIPSHHYTYSTILQIINLGIMELDEEGRFNPTFLITPSDAMISLKKILNGLEL
jgi:tetratricopeptide (TPR) repeat protein